MPSARKISSARSPRRLPSSTISTCSPRSHRVAIGIALDTIYSRKMGCLDAASAERVLHLLERLGFELFANELLNVDSESNLMVLKGLEEFREHLGGQLTLTLLKAIGQGFEVHTMNLPKVIESIYELQARHAQEARKIVPARG